MSKETVEGEDLQDVKRDDLTRWGITKFSHKVQIEREIQKLCQENNDINISDNNNNEQKHYQIVVNNNQPIVNQFEEGVSNVTAN